MLARIMRAGVGSPGTALGGLRVLILTRRVGETLKIGSNVSVTVVGLRGRHVRIGIAAPKDLPVHREELYGRLLTGQSLPQSRLLLGRP